MKKITLVLALICTAETAAAFDDPAVAICEFAWTRGNELPDGSWKRESAFIEGDTVRLVILYSPLNIRPKRVNANCTFENTNPLGLTLKRQEASVVSECRKKTEEARRILKDVSAISAAGDKAITTVKECEFTLQTASEERAKFDRLIENPLRRLQIYPINPKDTDIKVVGP